MAERNVPLPVTMEMAGHMSPKMTERYSRISSSAQRQAVELLDKQQKEPDLWMYLWRNKKTANRRLLHL